MVLPVLHSPSGGAAIHPVTPPQGSPRHILPWLAALLAFKLALLAVYGPLREIDTYGYEQFARLILTGGDWLHHLDLVRGEFLPIHAYRLPGYALVLAGAQMVFGGGWAYAVVVVQGVVSVLTLAVLWRVLRAMGCPFRRALLLALFVGVGSWTDFDQRLMADSLFTHLFLMAFLGVYLPVLQKRVPPLWRVAGWGVVHALAMLLKDVAWLFTLLPVVLLLRLPVRGWRRVARVGVFLVPCLVVVVTLLTWNHHRSGRAFVTFGLAPFLGPTLQIEHFQEGYPLDAYLKENLVSPHFTQWEPTLRQLHRREGWTTLDIGGAMQGRFARSLVHHPAAHLRHYLLNQASYSGVILNPLWSFFSFTEREDQAVEWMPERQRVAYYFHGIAPPGLRAGWLVVSVGCAVLLWWPVAAALWRRAAGEQRFMVLVILSTTSVFSLVHTNPRYVAFLPVLWALALAAGSRTVPACPLPGPCLSSP